MRLLWVVALVAVSISTMVTEICGQGLRPGRKPLDGLVWRPTLQERTIVGMCKENIGICASRQHGGEGRAPRFCPRRTIPCPIFKTVPVNCSTWGVFKVQKVIACKCCRSKRLMIKGVVIDSRDAAITLKNMTVSIRRLRRSRTNADGEFKIIVGSTMIRVVISVRDRSGTYISTVKVVDIPRGSRGPISVMIAMVKTAPPIEIDASADNTVSISSDPSDAEAGNATIKIAAGTFRNRGGSTYSGTVKLSLNFINTGDMNVEAEIPGVFLAGSQPLMTDGIFALTYKAEDGSRLRAGPMLVTVQSEMSLWSLSNTGGWRPLPDVRSNTRVRRQTSLTEFLVIIDNAQWVNIDKIPNAPRCYYKMRVYNEVGGTEIITSPTASFKPEILAYIVAQSQRLRLYPAMTSSPSAECFEARCPTNAADLLVGIVSMTSYEDVLVNGVFIPVAQKLRPKQLSQYTTAITTAHQGLQYALTPSLQEVFVNLLSNANGPFYTNKSVCDNSDASMPAFHFFKPELPSYLPYSDDVIECTARVYFTGRADSDVVAGYTGPPIDIAAISAWTQSGTNYFFTSNTVMQFSSNGGDFYFACLTYRCSQTNELTKVHVDINVPMVQGTSGTVVPLFKCTDGGNPGDVEGSFVAPASVGNGTDYYGSSPNDCSSRARNEAFARILYATHYLSS